MRRPLKLTAAGVGLRAIQEYLEDASDASEVGHALRGVAAVLEDAGEHEPGCICDPCFAYHWLTGLWAYPAEHKSGVS